MCRGLEAAGVKPNRGIGITEDRLDARTLFLTPNTTTVYEELNAVVQNEPADWVDPDTVGLYAVIGIRKGQPFAPGDRTKGILTDAVAVANAIARSNLFAPGDPATRLYTSRQWITPFGGGSYRFLSGAERLLDARAMFFYYATGITPAMTEAKPGTGSGYAALFRDSAGAYLNGGKTYKVALPGPIPAKDFWALTVYDNQTRSLLPTDRRMAGIDSTAPGLQMDSDGGATIWFGPKAPAGHDKSWQPGDFELER